MEGQEAAGMAGLIIQMVISIAIAVFMIICQWKVFEKAGKPGWAALVPVYNWIVMCEMAGKPAWWVVLFLCGGIGYLLICMELGERFGQSKGWGFGMLFLIGIVGWPMLAFGDYKYTPPPAGG